MIQKKQNRNLFQKNRVFTCQAVDLFLLKIPISSRDFLAAPSCCLPGFSLISRDPLNQPLQAPLSSTLGQTPSTLAPNLSLLHFLPPNFTLIRGLPSSSRLQSQVRNLSLPYSPFPVRLKPPAPSPKAPTCLKAPFRRRPTQLFHPVPRRPSRPPKHATAELENGGKCRHLLQASGPGQPPHSPSGAEQSSY